MSGESRRGSGIERALEIWFRRKWLAVATFAGPCAAAMALAVFLPDTFRAAATILVERQQIPESLVRPSVTTELETRLQTISQQILSRSRLQELIDRFNLYSELQGRVPREALIERVRRDIHLDLKDDAPSGGRGSTIAFTVSYVGRNPRTVAQVANTLASFYVEEDQQARARQTSGAAEFLKGQLDEAKRQLDLQDRRVEEFKKLHSGELPEQEEVNLATLERLNTELRLNSEAQIRTLESRDDLAKRLKEGGVADPGAVPAGPGGTLAHMKRDLTDLRLRYSDKYPEVAELKQRIQEIERQDAASGGEHSDGRPVPRDQDGSPARDSIDRAQASLKALQDEERRLRKAIDEYQRRVETAPEREQELRELSRDSLATRELYDSLSKRYEDAQIAESMETVRKGEQFRILDEAIVPEEPSGPNRRAIVLAGLIASFALAAAVVAVAEQLDTSFHVVADLRSFSRVPVLISIPRILTRKDVRRRRLGFGLAAVSSAGALTLIVAATRVIAHQGFALLALLPLR